MTTKEKKTRKKKEEAKTEEEAVEGKGEKTEDKEEE